MTATAVAADVPEEHEAIINQYASWAKRAVCPWEERQELVQEGHLLRLRVLSEKPELALTLPERTVSYLREALKNRFFDMRRRALFHREMGELPDLLPSVQPTRTVEDCIRNLREELSAMARLILYERMKHYPDRINLTELRDEFDIPLLHLQEAQAHLRDAVREAFDDRDLFPVRDNRRSTKMTQDQTIIDFLCGEDVWHTKDEIMDHLRTVNPLWQGSRLMFALRIARQLGRLQQRPRGNTRAHEYHVTERFAISRAYEAKIRAAEIIETPPDQAFARQEIEPITPTEPYEVDVDASAVPDPDEFDCPEGLTRAEVQAQNLQRLLQQNPS